ncbi:hypothetical protein ACFPME_17200 [Rhodanobacter umsongensis]|uniref:Sel1 repeat family protein n=1 Tax=Rhodanobacter umsongensis TaxID=633153 RepID=A0ABW0JR43_9GAMM
MRQAYRPTLVIVLAMLLVPCQNIAVAAAGTTQPPVGAAAPDEAALDASWAQVLNDSIPTAQRQQALSRIEQAAQATGNQHELYLLGSLYHMGEHAHGSFVPRDLIKASLYLGNAATRGSVRAMAKMAEVELAMHEYREAMNWAQIYGHYELLLPHGVRPHHGYAAELVQRIADKLGRSTMPEIMSDVNSFIASNDAAIRAGNGGASAPNGLMPWPESKAFLPPSGRLAPRAGFADYLLAFNRDGSLADMWLLDAVPDPPLGLALRQYAREMVVAPMPAGAGPALRYAWLPMAYDDGRYRAGLIH